MAAPPDCNQERPRAPEGLSEGSERGGRDHRIAVLVSGGLDSCVRLAELSREAEEVYPVYVRCGLRWEPAEEKALAAFCHAIRTPALQSTIRLECPVADLYGDHWAMTGVGIPGRATADDAVYLPGRNALLLTKAMLWSHLHHVPRLEILHLESNPFPDASSQFLAEFQAAVNRAVGGAVHVDRPYAHLTKAQVIVRGRAWPLGLTLSCLQPHGTMHCGRCNKCAERQRAFSKAGVPDPTAYEASPCTA
jgi:7-cyano-7-deazaguanine synthase